MKTISLKTETEKVLMPEGWMDVEFSTAKYIEIAINIPPQGGFMLDDYAQRMPIREKLKKLKPNATKLEVEDAEFETIKACVSSMPLNVLSSFLYEFKKQFA